MLDRYTSVTMIAYIKGTVLSLEEKYIVVLVSGIGYKISTPFEVITRAKIDSEIELWIHHHLRDDASDLYGFEKKDERDFFNLLLGISGIGPKSALNILNVATISDLKKAVSSSDTSHLIKVSGLSKKIAEKIVLELKGKFSDDETVSLKSEVEAIEALKALGYTQKEAREALKSIPNTLHTPEDRIKAALKILGK
ncbi:MAG: Holliday junction branch migration protein RuvA [bacterium]